MAVSKSVLLKNGDLLEFGSVILRFWMAPITQIGQRTTERKIWLGLGVLFLAQVTIIAWLLMYL